MLTFASATGNDLNCGLITFPNRVIWDLSPQSAVHFIVILSNINLIVLCSILRDAQVDMNNPVLRKVKVSRLPMISGRKFILKILFAYPHSIKIRLNLSKLGM